MHQSSYTDLAISLSQAREMVYDHYGLEGEVSKLPGDQDFNFRMKVSDSSSYTVKVTRPGTAESTMDCQLKIVEHLVSSHFPLKLPEVILTKDGLPMVKLPDQRYLKVQQWVPGRVLAEVNPRTTHLLHQWGQTCGLLSKHLAGFDHPEAHRFFKWDPSRTLASREYAPHLAKDIRETCDYFWTLFEEKTLPQLADLRTGVNYNDAHELNLLVNANPAHPEITGVIDFGDAVYTHTINELAIGCAYASMGFPDPLEAAVHLVRGYHNIFKVREAELQVLYSLIAARLLVTVTNAAWNRQHEPENAYQQISEQPAQDLLKRWRQIPPALAHMRFREACGLEPCPTRDVFAAWWDDAREQLSPPIEPQQKQWVPIDLAVDSADLGGNHHFDDVVSFEQTIRGLVGDPQEHVGVGGYAETRPFYSTDSYRVEGNQGAQWRTVHLGLDLWAPSGTDVLAICDGKVHSFQDNLGDCNYGPTIILQHDVSPQLTFYTLYGHLSRDSLVSLTVGQAVAQGERIAAIGAPPENGNWPPHLHFQVILDLLDWSGDFPGVAFPGEAQTWLSVCPDPTGLYPVTFAARPALPDRDLLTFRKTHLGRGLSVSYERPLHIVRGYKQYLYDTSARRYLDTVNNVPHVGHQHPRVVNAATRQMGLLNTNTRYLHRHIKEFAEALLQKFPEPLSVVHFVNSGSEANELAMRMVQAYTGQRDMIAVEASYHGNTGGCIDISSYKFDGKGGQGAPDTTQVVPMPDTYRGLYRGDPLAGKKYADHVREAVQEIQQRGRKVGGFICESILSCGGQIVLPEHYLAEAYRQVRAAGGVCIADEVQVGFGRVGEAFWGFQLQGVIPDIVTLGKPIGNGHPLGAVITTQAIADAFANGMEYFNTFGGNPVSCAIGQEVLKIIEDEQLQAHALEVGTYLRQQLTTLQQKYPIIGDVRGKGLFLGFELVQDHADLVPAPEQANYLINRMRERAILMSTDGPAENVIKIKPPMCFTKENADFLISNLDLVLGEELATSSVQ